MKKILFPLVAILLLAGCSSSEDVIDEPEPPKYSINSTVQVGDIKLQSYIFEGDYYIEAIDESGNKAFTINDKAEGYIEDLGFGETKEYPVRGCYIQSTLKKDDYLYILVSLYGDLIAHPHKFILKTKDGKVVKKEFFDKVYYGDYNKVFFYPEKMVDWYGEYIAIYTTSRTSLYDIAILDKDLKNIYGNNSPDVQNWIGYIERSNYISLSVKNMVYIAGNTVNCVDISKYRYLESFVWQTTFTDEEIRVDKTSYSLEGDNVIVDVEATTKAGEKKKYHLVLNKETGSLLNSES